MNDLLLQAPDAAIDRPMDWSDYLMEGETIDAFTPAITPDADLTEVDIDGAVTTVRVGDLTFGKVYTLKHAITTNAGREDVRVLLIRCGEQ